MTPAPETLLVGTEAPSLVGAALRMGLALAVLGLAAWGWLYWQRRVKGPKRDLEVLDRAVLARGASVALLRVGGRRLLVGVSGEGVRLIRDLEPAPGPAEIHSFSEVLTEVGDVAEASQ